MASKAAQIDDIEEDAPDPEIIFLTDEEASVAFDRAVQKMMGISGDEFIRRWDAGEYAEIFDKAGHRHILHLAMLIPFGR